MKKAKGTIKEMVYGLLKAKATKKLDNAALAKIAKKAFPKSAMKGWHISRYRYNMAQGI